jgi:hypothetical protein
LNAERALGIREQEADKVAALEAELRKTLETQRLIAVEVQKEIQNRERLIQKQQELNQLQSQRPELERNVLSAEITSAAASFGGDVGRAVRAGAIDPSKFEDIYKKAKREVDKLVGKETLSEDEIRQVESFAAAAEEATSLQRQFGRGGSALGERDAADRAKEIAKAREKVAKRQLEENKKRTAAAEQEKAEDEDEQARVDREAGERERQDDEAELVVERGEDGKPRIVRRATTAAEAEGVTVKTRRRGRFGRETREVRREETAEEAKAREVVKVSEAPAAPSEETRGTAAGEDQLARDRARVAAGLGPEKKPAEEKKPGVDSLPKGLESSSSQAQSILGFFQKINVEIPKTGKAIDENLVKPLKQAADHSSAIKDGFAGLPALIQEATSELEAYVEKLREAEDIAGRAGGSSPSGGGTVDATTTGPHTVPVTTTSL